MTDKQHRQTTEAAPDAASSGGELTVTEEWGDSAQEPYAPEIFQTETVFEKNRTDDMPLDSVLEKPLIRPDLRPTMRLRVILNENEIPSREDLEKQTFNDSSDFFEEAPDRISGVTTSEELEEPVESDVAPVSAKEKKPSKAKRSQGRPDDTRAGMHAVGPGRVSTTIPSSAQARASRKPGSEMPGVPASETSATLSPPRMRSLTASTVWCSFHLWWLWQGTWMS